jgi:hypothetical protein
MMTKLKIDAHRTGSGTQGRLHGALTSQEIAKYVEHCLEPGKAPGPDKCPNEPLKTMSDEKFLIVQAWVNEILTLPEKTIYTFEKDSCFPCPYTLISSKTKLCSTGSFWDIHSRTWKPADRNRSLKFGRFLAL